MCLYLSAFEHINSVIIIINNLGGIHWAPAIYVNFYILFEQACLCVPPAATSAPGGYNMNYVTPRSAVLLFSWRNSI
jgi:hypothetical protein